MVKVLEVKSCDDEPYGDIIIKQVGGRNVAKLWLDDAPVHDYNSEQECYAKLFAAAPELLEQIEHYDKVLRWLIAGRPDEHTLKLYKKRLKVLGDLIKKAKGN